MKTFSFLLILFLLSCGSNDPNACNGVDTSQAPDRIEHNTFLDGHSSSTYHWGGALKHITIDSDSLLCYSIHQVPHLI